MSTKLEQVEILRQKANVSYDEAKEALDAVDGDLLEAIILLERKGKVEPPSGGGFYNSNKGTGELTDRSMESDARGNNDRHAGSRGEGFRDLIKRFGRFCAMLLHKGNINSFEILKHDQVKAAFPVTALVLLLAFLFWVTLPLLIVGLFFGFRYRFRGPDLGKDVVNGAMNDVADTAEQIKSSLTGNREKNR